MNALRRLNPKQRVALVAVLALGAYLFLRNRAAPAIDGSLTPPGVETDTTSAGTSSGGDALGGDTSQLVSTLQQQGELIAGLQSRLDDLGATLSTPMDAAAAYDPLAGAGDYYPADYYPTDYPADGAGANTGPNDVGPAGQTPAAAPGNAKATEQAGGFWWNIGGKRTYITAANKQLFYDELRRHGENVSTWAQRHPAAAAALGVSASGSPFVGNPTLPPRPSPTQPIIPNFGHVRPNDRPGRLGIGGQVRNAIQSNSRSRSLQDVQRSRSSGRRRTEPPPRAEPPHNVHPDYVREIAARQPTITQLPARIVAPPHRSSRVQHWIHVAFN